MDMNKMPLSNHLSKASDTLDNNILLSKLNQYDITGAAKGLFKGYSIGRKQYVYNSIIR